MVTAQVLSARSAHVNKQTKKHRSRSKFTLWGKKFIMLWVVCKTALTDQSNRCYQALTLRFLQHLPEGQVLELLHLPENGSTCPNIGELLNRPPFQTISTKSRKSMKLDTCTCQQIKDILLTNEDYHSRICIINITL